MNLSHSLRKRFLKDCKIPINLLQDPYFDYFLDLYEDLYQSRTLYTLFHDLVERLGGEEFFFKEAKRITDSIIKDISSTVAFQKFNTEDLSRYDIVSEVSQQSIYTQKNAGHGYASFDLIKANYNALKFIDPDIVFNTKNYEELFRPR